MLLLVTEDQKTCTSKYKTAVVTEKINVLGKSRYSVHVHVVYPGKRRVYSNALIIAQGLLDRLNDFTD